MYMMIYVCAPIELDIAIRHAHSPSHFHPYNDNSPSFPCRPKERVLISNHVISQSVFISDS